MKSAFRRALVDALLPGGIHPHHVILPSAGDIGLAAAPMNELALQLVAAAAGSEESFISSSPAQREAAVKAASDANPAIVNAFVAALLTRYYEDPRIIAGFGWPERPPQPAGHQLEPFDAELVREVRSRKTMWRAT